jgi:Retroviral aspartyl protease
MVQALKVALLTRKLQGVVAASIKEKKKRLVFVLKKGEEVTLDALIGVVGSRACTFKDKYNNKNINILVDIGCDITCVASRIVPRNEWYKVHNLQVQGFNEGLVKCLTKTDITWEMGEIKTGSKTAWILPTLAYDLIVGTDWLVEQSMY